MQPWHVHNWLWFEARAPWSSGHVTARWEAAACAGSRAPGRRVEAAAPRGVDSGSAMRGDQAGHVESAGVVAGGRRR